MKIRPKGCSLRNQVVLKKSKTVTYVKFHKNFEFLLIFRNLEVLVSRDLCRVNLLRSGNIMNINLLNFVKKKTFKLEYKKKIPDFIVDHLALKIWKFCNV